MSVIRRSVIASVADKYATQVISVVTLATMSRILTPSETGIYLLASTVILLLDNLRLFGTGIFIVQEKTLAPQTVRTVFTITLLISLSLAGLLVAASDLIAGFFHEPQVGRLLVVAALSFVIAPFGGPLLALMQRDLSFTRLAMLNVAMALVVFFAYNVAGFRELRVWRGAGSEVDVRGCSYGDQRPRRIVSCLHRAVEEKRLRLPEAPDRVLTLRQIVRSDHPTWSRERQRREVRQLTREVRRTTEQGVRPGDIASAQVDDAAKPGTPLDVLVVRVRDHWGLYWLETRTRVQE